MAEKLTTDIAGKVFATIISSAILFLVSWFWHISTIVDQNTRDLDNLRPIISDIIKVERDIAVIQQVQDQERQVIGEVRADLRDIARNRKE